MKKFWIIVVVIAAVIVVGLLASVSVRNSLIARDEAVNENWSQIETQLQRRGDLIPNLVATVRGYAGHEEKIFTEVAAARSRLLAAGSPQEKAEAAVGLNGVLGRLLAISEQYPNLKADQNFIRLQDELAGTENRISVARTRYNTAVRNYNAAIRQFPGALFASSLGLDKREYFEAPQGRAAVEKAPEVKF